MENQENNNLSELEQLKAQYETLKQQFDQQEIVNERLMQSSIRHGMDFYKRYRRRQFILYPLFAIIGILCIKWYQNSDLSMMLFWLSFCSVCFAIELWTTRKLRIKELENNDLLTLSHQARNFKKLFSIFTALNYFTAVFIVFGVVFSRIGREIHLPDLGAVFMLFVALLVFFVLLCFFEIRYKTRACDEIIRQIAAAENSTEKKTGFSRGQKWLCAAMMAALVGLDVWACLIINSHVKVPAMWATIKLEYWRAADDLSTEGKLEIWDADADTVAISSAILDGKPLVRYVSVSNQDKVCDLSAQVEAEFTPEAARLWQQFTTRAKGHRAALYLDGVEVQNWQIQYGIDNGCFFIMKNWSSKEELETFIRRLIRQ